jgi:excisionase family DNA binding protein
MRDETPTSEQPADSSQDTPDLMSVEEAARALRVSHMTVRRMIRDEEIPAVITRRRYAVPRAFVEKVLADAVAGNVVRVADYALDWTAQMKKATA